MRDVLAPPVAATRLVQAIRLRDWWHFLLLPLASAQSALQLLRGVGIAFCILAFGYLVNGLSDRQLDSDLKKSALAHEPSGLRLLVALFAGLALLLSLSGPSAVTIATLVSLSAGTVYSVGPRLKRFPLVGTLANAACFSPLLWLGVRDGAPGFDLLTLGASFVLLLLQNQLVHEAVDREDDARGGVLTTFRALGPRATAGLAMALGIGLSLLAPRPALAVAMLAAFVLAFPLALFRRGDDVTAMRTTRLVHRLSCIVAGGALFAALRFFPA